MPQTIQAPASAAMITAFGVATGIPADLIAPAMVGALYACKNREPATSIASLGAQVVAGALFAAWTAHPAALMATYALPDRAGLTAEMLRFPMAVVLGWGGLRTVLPKAEALVDKFFADPKRADGGREK